MGTKQSKQESMVIEATSTRSNVATQQVSGFTKTDWHFGAMGACLLIGFILFFVQKCGLGGETP